MGNGYNELIIYQAFIAGIPDKLAPSIDGVIMFNIQPSRFKAHDRPFQVNSSQRERVASVGWVTDKRAVDGDDEVG